MRHHVITSFIFCNNSFLHNIFILLNKNPVVARIELVYVQAYLNIMIQKHNFIVW